MARGRRRRRRQTQDVQAGTVQQMTVSEAFARWDAMNEAADAKVSVTDSYRHSAWVYGAINAIAWNVANWPQVVLGKGEDRITSGPLVDLIERPNDYTQQNTSTNFRFAYLTELLLNGAVCRAFPEMSGFMPRRQVVLPRWRFTVQDRVDAAGVKVPVRWQLHTAAGLRTYVDSDTLYHDALYNPFHDWEGLSPLEAALVGINNDIDTGEFAHRFFKNDGSTGLVFTSEHPGFRQPQADEASKRWNEKYGGVSKAFGTKFVGFGLKPHQVGSQFDADAHRALKSLTKEEIVTGIYKIPLAIFGAEQATAGVQIGGNDADSAQESFLVNVVMPWAKRYDDEFERDVAWRFRAATGEDVRAVHDFDGHPLLEKRKLQRAKIAVELIDRGIPINVTTDWLRLNIQTQAWGDEWWVPNNMIPASVIQAAGDKALFGSQPNASNAGAKNGKPGVRDHRGHPDGDRKQVLEGYVNDILRLAETTDVRNAARGANGTGFAHRLADILKEVGA